jgi:DNA topoisomerase VI subunit A
VFAGEEHLRKTLTLRREDLLMKNTNKGGTSLRGRILIQEEAGRLVS